MEEYSQLELKNIIQIYGALEVNIPYKYKFSSDTNIIVLDCSI